MNSYKKLANNSIIFGIGSIGSKLISFVLLPLYTYYLTTSEFGTADLISTTATMLMPLVSFNIYEAVLRFTMDRNSNITKIFSTSLLIAVIGCLILLFLIPIISFFGISGKSLTYLYFTIVVQVFERIFAQFARGLGKTKIYAINGIILTLFICIFNILFLVFYSFGVDGYLLSTILANIISIIFLFYSTKAYIYIKWQGVDYYFSHLLIKYTAPLIPNTLIWWLINSSSRYFINYFVGIEANGLFAVSSKIPSLINIVSQIFMQAWQLSAIEEYEEKKSGVFYSKIFNFLFPLILMISSFLLILIKPIFIIFFSADYYSAWRVVPFLLLGSIFSSFSSFFGATYIASKQTIGIFSTSIYGGLISIILNIILIPFIGTIGAGISSMVSFFIMFKMRFKDTNKVMELSINWKQFYLNLFVILFQIIVLFLNLSNVLSYSILIILFILIIFLNWKSIANIMIIIKKIFYNKITNKK